MQWLQEVQDTFNDLSFGRFLEKLALSNDRFGCWPFENAYFDHYGSQGWKTTTYVSQSPQQLEQGGLKFSIPYFDLQKIPTTQNSERIQKSFFFKLCSKMRIKMAPEKKAGQGLLCQTSWRQSRTKIVHAF